MTSRTPAAYFNVDVSGAKTLTLKVDACGDQSADHGNWADAKFLRYEYGISGSVDTGETDLSKKDIPVALYKVTDGVLAEEAVAETTTTTKGNYYFTEIAAGTYAVKIAAGEDNQEVIQEVTIEKESVTDVDLNLVLPVYEIAVATVDGASAVVDKAEAIRNETITISVGDIAADKEFDTVNVIGADGSEIPTTDSSDDTGIRFTFTMPKQNVTVNVVLKDNETYLAAVQAAAEADAKILAIGEVTLEKKDAITEARTAYDALSELAKSLVANGEILKEAEHTLEVLTEQSQKAELEKELQDTKDELQGTKDALTAETAAKEQLAAALKAKEEALAAEIAAKEQLAAALQEKEDALTAETAAKEQLAAALQAKEEALAAETTAKEQLAAALQAKEEALAAETAAKEQLEQNLGNTEEELAAAEAAKTQLAAALQAKEEALTAETAAKEQLAAALKTKEEALAAETEAKENLSAALKEKEDALTAETEAKENLETALQAKEEALAAEIAAREALEAETLQAVIEQNRSAAQVVEALIRDISEVVTLDCEEKVYAARAAYEVLTAEQKSYVTNLDALLAGEQKLSECKKAPAKVTLSTVRGKSGAIIAKWKKVEGADGYQIKYSLKAKKKYKNAGTVTKLNKKIRGLKKGKKYYVKVRAYKIIDGKKVYGEYSKAKRVKVK